MPQNATAEPPARVLIGVGLIAATTLALQVVLTRIFSAALYYHFSFLAISLALVGTGAGAIVIYVRPNPFDRQPLEHLLARLAALLAVSLVVLPTILVRLDLTFNGKIDGKFAFNLALACFFAFVPSFLAGCLIALAIRGYTSRIGRVYAFDLCGAGIGAFAVVPVMWWLDAPTLVVALGAVAGAAAAFFGGPDSWHLGATTAALTCLAVVISANTTINYLSPRFTLPEGAVARADQWMPLSRVLAYQSTPSSLLFYDRVFAPVPNYDGKGPLPDWRALQSGPQSIGYAVSAHDRGLVIGGGGGRDIFTALSSGERRVDVIEVNSTIRDVVDKKLRAGHPYSLPGVHTTIGDGRSVLAARKTKYDDIHIGFTDSYSGNSAQAFALTENNLYTVEAFDEYFDHLTPDGVLNVSRLYHPVGNEALRATVLAMDALARRGVKDPSRNVVVILGHDWPFGNLYATVLAKTRPYTTDELATIRRLATERGAGVAFAPGGPYYKEWRQLAAAPNFRAFCKHYSDNTCAPTDDKPFFFNMQRLGDLMKGWSNDSALTVDPTTLLALTLVILLGLSAIALAAPLLLVDRVNRPPTSQLRFFAAIGVGFLMFEIVLIQRFVLFLGFPTYALSVVLFSLLIFAGIGSALSARWRNHKRALTIDLTVISVLIAVSAFTLQPILRNLIDLPFATRVLIAIIAVAPFGISMGMAMPIGLWRLSQLYPASVPWAWGINGVASVVASVLAIFIAIFFGFAAASFVAAACYVVALADAALGRWPTPDENEAAALPEAALPVASGAPSG